MPMPIPNDGFMLNFVANMTVHRIAADILDETEYIRRYAVDNFKATLKSKTVKKFKQTIPRSGRKNNGLFFCAP